MRIIEVPELPNGYRFKVELDYIGNVCVTLERKHIFFWRRVDRTWPHRLYGLNSLELRVQDGMFRLLQRNKEKTRDLEVQNRVLGIYPPRKVIGEVNEG